MQIAYGGFALAFKADDPTVARMMRKIEFTYDFAIAECAKNKHMKCHETIKNRMEADIAQSQSAMQNVGHKNEMYMALLTKLKTDLNDPRFTENVVRAFKRSDLWSSAPLNLDLIITDIDITLSEDDISDNCAAFPMMRLMVRLARIKLGIQKRHADFLQHSTAYVMSELHDMRAELNKRKCVNGPLIRIAERVQHQCSNIESEKFNSLVSEFGKTPRRNSFNVNFMEIYYNEVVSQIIAPLGNDCRGFLIAVRKDIEKFHKEAQECPLKPNAKVKLCKMGIFAKLTHGSAFKPGGVHCNIDENTFVSTLYCYVEIVQMEGLEDEQIEKFVSKPLIKGEPNLIALYQELLGNLGAARDQIGENGITYFSDITRPVGQEILYFLHRDSVESMIDPNEPIEIYRCINAVADAKITCMKKVIQYYIETFESFELDAIIIKSNSPFRSFPSRFLANLRKSFDLLIAAFEVLNNIVRKNGKKKATATNTAQGKPTRL